MTGWRCPDGDGDGALLRARSSPWPDRSYTAYPHRSWAYPHRYPHGGWRYPQQVRPYVPQLRTVRVGEPWSKPSTTPDPGRSERPRTRRVARRVPPHDLEAEESLLGAMLLSNDAASVGIEKCSAGDFYKPAHGHIFGAIRALMERGEAIDAVTVTDELKRSGVLEQVGDPSIFISLAGQHALDRQRAALRRDRRGARAAAPAHRGGGGDRRHRLLGARGREGGRRRGGAAGVRRGRAPDGRHHGTVARAAGQGAGPDRGAGPARLAHHRRGHGLPRAGPDPARLPALLAQHRRRPSRHGQDQLRAGGPGQRRDGGAATGAPLLPGDGPPGADPAPAGLGGRGQRAEPADRAGSAARTGARSGWP